MGLLEDYLQKYGNPGKFQVFTVLLLSTGLITANINNNIMVFFGASPSHRCNLPSNWTWFLNDSIPMENGQYSKCVMYLDPSNHSRGVTGCQHGWHYDTEPNQVTIVTEWDLVCEKDYLSSLATSLYFSGISLGAVTLGFFSDRFGRKNVILGGILLYTLAGTAVGVSPNLPFFIVFRILQGFMLQGILINCYSLAYELLSKDFRTEAAIVMSTAFAFGGLVIAGIAYFVKNWRHIQATIIVPQIAYISFIWILPESIRWLIINRQLEKAEWTFRRVARFNNIPVSPKLKEEIEELSTQIIRTKSQQNYDIRDLFRTPKLRKYTLILGFNWFAASLTYFGITYYIPLLGSNIYTSLVISGSIDLLTRAPLYLILRRFGRKSCHIVSLLIGAVACCLCGVLDYYIGIPNLTIALALIGKSISLNCFVTLAIIYMETYPTVVRATGSGLGNTFNRLAAMLAPQFQLIGKHTWKPLPLLIFAAFAGIASFLMLKVPETMNQPLPETIEEIENIPTNNNSSADSTTQERFSKIKEKTDQAKDNENFVGESC